MTSRSNFKFELLFYSLKEKASKRKFQTVAQMNFCPKQKLQSLVWQTMFVFKIFQVATQNFENNLDFETYRVNSNYTRIWIFNFQTEPQMKKCLKRKL